MQFVPYLDFTKRAVDFGQTTYVPYNQDNS
jgi:hypothetical protein